MANFESDDYYDNLGVERTATEAEIKAAYALRIPPRESRFVN